MCENCGVDFLTHDFASKREGTIPVLEIFGPTIQGEGSVIGRKTMFVRTAGCDSRCVWCDSAFTWDGSAKHLIQNMPAKDIVDALFRLGGVGFDKFPSFNHVTISGGNPALIGDGMMALVWLLKQHGIEVGLETQGTVWKDWFTMISDLTLSPKPPSAVKGGYDEQTFDFIVRRLRDLGHSGHSIKVVVFDDQDYEFARTVHLQFPRVPFYLQVGNADVKEVHPVELSQALLGALDALITRVISDPLMNSVRVLPQLHTLLWGNKRGV